jgi:predicted MFS family arabinose efflux permease
MNPPSARQEWESHWLLLLCCLLGITVPIVPIYALGQFLPSIEESFGWTRTQASVGLTLSLAITFLVTPIVGRVIDRTDARKLVLPGIVLCGLVSAAFSRATGSIGNWLGLWACQALASTLICPAVWLPVVASTFTTNRSMAMAIALCGISLPAAYGPPLARVLIDHFGWRLAYQILALVVAIPALVCSALFFVDGRVLGTRESAQGRAAAVVARRPLRRIYLSSTFLKLAVAIFASYTASAALFIHLAPILVDRGLAPMTAATIAGIAGLIAIGGKLLLGAIFDRIRPERVGAGLMILFALACMIFAIQNADMVTALAASMLLAVCAGGMVALLACITPKLFSATVFGSVYAALLSLTALGGAIGPLLASIVHDATGSYAPAFLAGIIIAGAAAALFVGLKPLKDAAA